MDIYAYAYLFGLILIYSFLQVNQIYYSSYSEMYKFLKKHILLFRIPF